MEREERIFRAAQSAFLGEFVGARLVAGDVVCGDGPRWSWIAELADGRLCAVLVAERGDRELAGALLDGAVALCECEATLRRALGLGAGAGAATPRVMGIVRDASRSFEQRLVLSNPEQLTAYCMFLVETPAQLHVELVPLSTRADAQSTRTASGSARFRSLAPNDREMLAIVKQRMERLDPAVECDAEGAELVYRVHGHELARVDSGASVAQARVGDPTTAIALESVEDLETFFAKVVERYLELGCWTGADGGAAALALGEPLLSHEEMAAFRELA